MDKIVLLPALVALYVAVAQSPERAFLRVYLPIVFLLPDYYRMITPGMPDPTFSEAAIIPIFLVFLARGVRGWRFTLTDLFVLGFAASIGYSQYQATGWSDAQNLIFDMIGSVLMPYVLAKAVIETAGMRVEFAKQLIWILLIVVLTEAYEFRFMMNPFRRFLDPFFPGQGQGWLTTIRGGFGRAAGPYGHAILCGIVMATGFRLHRWTERIEAWRDSAFGPYFGKVARVVLLVGMGMTNSRGPWLGAFVGSFVTFIGFGGNRKKRLGLVVAFLLIVGVPAGLAFNAYVSVGRRGASSDVQETAAYRKELIDKYVDIAIARSAWGWGQNTWPRVPGMPSIDNHYLNLALRHGFIAVGFFCLILLHLAVKLWLYAWRAPSESSSGRLAWTLLAAFVAIGFAVGTVYLGLQTIQLFFLLAGWAGGLLVRRPETAESTVAAGVPAAAFRFRRVVA